MRKSPDISLNSIRCLIEAIELGNLTHAAHRLGITVSSLSRRISTLEDQLGLTLIERNHFGIRPTTAAGSSIVRMRRILHELSALRNECHRGGRGKVGTLRFGVRAPPNGGPILPALTAWRREFPDVDLVLHELSDHALRVALTEGRLDVALVACYAQWPGAAFFTLYEERLVMAAPRFHPLSRYASVEWDQVRSETILTQDWGSGRGSRDFFFSLMGPDANFEAHPASEHSILSLVSAGFGVTFIAESHAVEPFPGIEFTRISEANANVRLNLVWREAAEETTLGRFIVFMRNFIRRQ